MKKYLILLVSMLVFWGCSTKQEKVLDKLENQTSFSIKDNLEAKDISYNELIEKLKDYDIVIIGEFHDNVDHHLAELALVKSLETYGKRSVAFEMFNTDRQKFIDKAKTNKDKIEAKDLAKALHWQEDWYWEDYQNVVSYVFYSDNKLLAANLNEKELDLIYSGKKLKPLKGELSTSLEVKTKLKDLINSFHSMSEEASNTFVEMQMRKDRSMAEVLLKSKEPVILICGMFHASKDVGITLHIKDLDKTNKKVAVIALDPEGMSNANTEADFVFHINYKDDEEKK
ncbi:ChaN family lipoprotein [Campylobacter sp. MIT 99-7217]|uniref:ChaN family lipoprotein n=1 Tax=Campylobacter sp. MIT 99-7217 TaxID=535091 RepID=UPI00163C1605|nr:ChaN family lipoprotein [Campylobacter sp. MIT 99-7217]